MNQETATKFQHTLWFCYRNLAGAIRHYLPNSEEKDKILEDLTANFQAVWNVFQKQVSTPDPNGEHRPPKSI